MPETEDADSQDVIKWADGVKEDSGISENSDFCDEILTKPINRFDEEKTALLNFAAETHQPLKPMVCCQL